MVAYSPPETILDWLLDLPGTLGLDRSAPNDAYMIAGYDRRTQDGQTWQKKRMIIPGVIWDMGRKENKPRVKGKELDSCGQGNIICTLIVWGVTVPYLLAEIPPGVTSNFQELENPRSCCFR